MARKLSFSRLTPQQQEFVLGFVESNGGAGDNGTLLEFQEELFVQFGLQLNPEQARRILGKAKKKLRGERLPKRKGSRKGSFRNRNGHLGLSAY